MSPEIVNGAVGSTRWVDLLIGAGAAATGVAGRDVYVMSM